MLRLNIIKKIKKIRGFENSNTTNVKVKQRNIPKEIVPDELIQIQPMLRLNPWVLSKVNSILTEIQIQPMLRLNFMLLLVSLQMASYSNTTNVKVKLIKRFISISPIINVKVKLLGTRFNDLLKIYSNTTNVKVKLFASPTKENRFANSNTTNVKVKHIY